MIDDVEDKFIGTLVGLALGHSNSILVNGQMTHQWPCVWRIACCTHPDMMGHLILKT